MAQTDYLQFMMQNPNLKGTEQEILEWTKQQEEEKRKAEEERKKKEAEERAKANLKANQEKAKQYTAEAQAKKNEGNAVQRLAKSLFGFTPEEEAQYNERATLFTKTKQLAESKNYVPPNKRTDFTSTYDVNQQQPIDATKKYEYGKHYTSKELREGLLNKELYYANDSFYRVFTDNDGNQQTESVPFLKLQRNGILAVPRYNIIDKEYGEGLPISFVSEKATETEQEFQKLAREKTMEQIDKQIKEKTKLSMQDFGGVSSLPIDQKTGRRLNALGNIEVTGGNEAESEAFSKGFKANPIIGAATGRYDYQSEQTGKKLDLKGAYGRGKMAQDVATGIAGAFTGAAVANVAKLGVGATAVATGIAGAAPMQPTYLDQLRKGSITKGQYGAYTLADVGSMTIGSYIGQKFNAAKFMGEAIDAAKKGERVMPLVFKNYFKEVGVSTLAETPFNIASSAASAATAPQEDFNKAFLINMGLQTGMSLSMEGVVDLLGARGNVKSYKYLQDGVNSGRWKNADDMANDIFTRFDVKNKKTQEKIKNYATDIYRGKTVLETPEQKGITAMVQGDLGMPKTEGTVKQTPPSPEQQVEALKQTEGDMIAAIEGIKEKEQLPDKDIRARNKNLGIDNDDPATSATINKGAFDAYSKLTGEELDINNPEHYKTVQQVKNDVLNGQSTLKPKHLYDPDTESYQNLMVKQGANTVGNEAENVRNHLLRINEIQEVLDDVVRINETANNMDRATTLTNISHNAGGKADIDPWNVILEKTYPSRRLAMGEVEVDATLENVHKWMLANSMPNEKLMGDVPMTKSEIDKYTNNIIDKSGHRPQSNLMFGDSEIQNVRRPTPQELKASTNKIRLLQDEYKASKNQISLASKKATPEELSAVTSKMKGLQNSIAAAEKELNKGSVDLAKVNEIQADIKAKAGDVLRELDVQSKPTKEGAKPQIRREVAKEMASAVSGMRKKMDSYANALKEMDNLERGLSKGVKEAKPTEAVNPFTGDVTKDVTRMELVNKEIESAAQKYDNDILEYSASVNTFGVTPAEYIDIKTNPDPRGSQQLQNAEYAVQEAMRNAEEGSDISMAQMNADDAAIREVEILAHDPDDINTTELMKQQAGVPSVMTYGKVPEGIDPNHILGNPKYNEVAKEFIGGALIAAGFMNGDDNEGATPVFSAALLIGGMPMTARYHTLRDALMKRVGGIFAPKTMWGQTLLGNPYNISDNDLVANIRNSPAYAALRPGVAGEKFVNEIKDISKRQDGIIGNFLNGKWMTWEMMDKRAEKTAPNMDEFYKEQTGMGKAASISALLRAKIKPKSVLNDHKRVLQDMEKQLQKIKSPIKTKIDDIEALGLGSATFTDIHQQANDFENQTKFLPKDQRYQFVQRESSTDKNVVKAINDFTNLTDQLLYREGAPLSRKTKSDWVKKIDDAWENYKTQKLLSLQTQDNFNRTVDLLQGKYGKDFTPEDIATYSDKYYTPMKKYFERTERREWDARAIQKTGRTIDELRSEMPDRELAFNQFTAKEAELKAEVQKYANQITYRNKQIGALEYLAKDTRTLPDQKTKYINTISALKDSKKEIQKKMKEISNEYKTLRGGPEYRLAKETLLNAKNLVQQSDVAVRRGYMNTKLMSEYGKRYHINVSEIDPETGQMIHYANSNVRTAGFSKSIHQTKKDLDKFLTERNGTPVAQDQVFGNNSSPRPLWFMTEIDVVDRYGKKVIDENGNPKRTMVKVEVKDRYAFSPVFNQTKEQLTQLVGIVLGKNGVSSSTNPSVVKLNKDAFDNQVRALRSSIDELRSASDDTDIDGMNDQVETMNKVLSSLEGVYGNKPTEATGRDVVRLLSMLRNPDPFLIPTKNYDFYSLGEGAKYGNSLKEFWEGTQGDHVARAKTALNKAEAGNIFLQAAEELNKQHQLGINNRMTAYLQGIIERGDSYINKVSKHDIIRTGQIKSLSGARIWDVKKTIQNATAFEAFRLLGFNVSSGIKNIVGSTSGSIMASGLMAGTYKQAMAEPWKSAAGRNILSALKNGQFLRNLSPDQVATIEKNALAIQDITERAKLLAIIKSYKGGLFNNDIDLGAFENKGILGRAITKGRDASMYVMGATEFFNNVGAGTRAIDDYANKYPYDATKHGEVEDYIDWLAQVGYTQAGFVNGKYGDNDVPPILRPLLNSWIGRPLTLMMKPALQQYSLGAQLVTDYFFRAKNSPNKNTALRYVPLVALASASIPVMMLQGDDGMPVISDILNLTNTLLNKINQEEDGPKAVQEKIRIGKALDDLVYAGMDNAHNKFGVDVDNMKRFWQTMHKGMLSAITEQAGFGVDMSMPSNVDDFFTPVLANEVKTFYTDLGKSYFEADNVWDALSQAGIKHIVPIFAKNIVKTAYGMVDGKYYTGLIEQSSMDVQWTWAHAILGMPLQAREAVTNQYEMINPLTVPEQKANYIKTVINNNSQDAVFLDYAETGQNRQQDKAYAIKETAKYAPEIKEKLLTEFHKPKIQEAIERDCKKLEEYLTKKRKGSSYVSRLEEYTRRDIETNSELITSNNKNNDASEKELRQYVGQYYYSLVLNKLINDNPKTYGKYISSQLNSDYGRKSPGYEFAVSKWRKAVGVDEDY